MAQEDLATISAGLGIPLEGCHLVLSGPGGGKTTLLVNRVAAILETFPKDRFRVLGLTFTNKAARQMEERLGKDYPKLSAIAEERLLMGTFHSFCGKILKSYGHHLKLSPGFQIIDTPDCKALLIELQEKGELPEGLRPDNLVYVFSSLKSRDTFGVVGNPDTKLSPGLMEAYKVYQRALEEIGGVDFGDLILKTTHLLIQRPDIQSFYHKAFRYILVDEFQDTTPAQYAFLKALVPQNNPNVFAVADEDQLIYEWNEARLETLNHFVQDFKAKHYFSTLTYRCPLRVVKAANAVIQNNQYRVQGKPEILALPEKKDTPSIFLFKAGTSDGEANFVSNKIIQLKEQGISLSEICVMTRQHYHFLHIEKALQDVNIPSKRARNEILSTDEGRVILSILRLAISPFDNLSLRRILTEFAPSYLAQKEEWLSLAEATQSPIDSVIINFLKKDKTSIESEEDELLIGVMRILSNVRGYASNVNKALEIVSEKIPRLFENIFLEGEKTEALTEVFKILKRVARDRKILTTGSISDLLDNLGFIPELTEPSVTGDAVSLLTCHQAKGLEFRIVFLVALEKGLFPDYRSERESRKLEEERRLFYVSITRTKERLYLTYSLQRPDASGTLRSREASRFLLEIPNDLVTVVPNGNN
ncbi:MAG: ATP-dependent DNA helicase PcrA [candidate division WS2 bacterium]|nr:ATP-dependent DNA helicase PcrA [Candidatus Lithacetigena glycinireducens]MBT9174908.1 ATP-dependent DNA helicase PcrA [Candidatus Lithacetigena glycinireducens]